MSFVIAGGNDNHFLEASLKCVDTESLPSRDDLISNLARYGVVLLMEETSAIELKDLSSELPTDTHLVRYRGPGDHVGQDAVRSYSKSDIFDAYHDMGRTVIEITNGFGSIKPKLFTDKRRDADK